MADSLKKIKRLKMANMKETIDIKQVHDNNKYIVTRKTVEELNGQELLKIYNDINDALKNTNQQLSDLPKQYDQRFEFLGKEKKMLDERKEVFEKYVKGLKEVVDSEEKGANDGNKTTEDK